MNWGIVAFEIKSLSLSLFFRLRIYNPGGDILRSGFVIIPTTVPSSSLLLTGWEGVGGEVFFWFRFCRPFVRYISNDEMLNCGRASGSGGEGDDGVSHFPPLVYIQKKLESILYAYRI